MTASVTPATVSTAPDQEAVDSLVPAVPRLHVHLRVADLERSVAFYRAVLGTDPVKRFAGYAKFLPVWAPLNLALSQAGPEQVSNPNPGSSGSAVSHLGLQIASTALVRRHLDRIAAHGLATRGEFAVDCCHANQDKFWITDPDGIAWEIYHLNHDLADRGDGGADGSALVRPVATKAGCCAGSRCG